jgi:hypothetical protein
MQLRPKGLKLFLGTQEANFLDALVHLQLISSLSPLMNGSFIQILSWE